MPSGEYQILPPVPPPYRFHFAGSRYVEVPISTAPSGEMDTSAAEPYGSSRGGPSSGTANGQVCMPS